MKIKTLTLIQHNKTDIVIQKKENISDGLDLNITKNFNQKRDNCLPLAAELKHLYDTFDSKIIPITIGETGLVPNDLKLMLKGTGLENINDVTLKCQKSVSLYIENCKKFYENVNDLNLHSAMISDNLAFQTNLAVTVAILLCLVGVYTSLPHEGV